MAHEHSEPELSPQDLQLYEKLLDHLQTFRLFPKKNLGKIRKFFTAHHFKFFIRKDLDGLQKQLRMRKAVLQQMRKTFLASKKDPYRVHAEVKYRDLIIEESEELQMEYNVLDFLIKELSPTPYATQLELNAKRRPKD